VFDTRAAFPQVAIVGVGGVSRGEDAVALLEAGANAVQVGTATFADPRAPARVLDELERWCARRGVRTVEELVAVAHPEIRAQDPGVASTIAPPGGLPGQ
jgi:dihydroorotate dehydrogenase (NAD+) catalytic subunit